MIDDKSAEQNASNSNESDDFYNTEKDPVSPTLTVIGLLNGMIGAASLLLPFLGLKTGWLMSIIVVCVIAWMCYYTAYLNILHLGKGKQIRDCILNHFSNDYKYMRGYSFFIWLSFIAYALIYFRIICLQLEGLLGYHSDHIGPIVAGSLIIIIILVRIYHVGEQTLAYGIISIIAYLSFLVWAQFSAPKGPKTVIAIGSPVSLASSLITAYAIHDFLVANILKNPDRATYHSSTRRSFFIGSIAYIFCCLGSFAIANRTSFKQHPQTINDYFKEGQWQNKLIEVIYVVHMITAYPNFLIISKQKVNDHRLRFFQIFNIEVKRKVTCKQILYLSIITLCCYLVYVSGVHVEVMVTLNGAIIAFIYVSVIPIWLHFKCVFYDRSSGYIQNDPEWNSGIVANKCECDNVYKNKFLLYLQTVFLIVVIVVGLALMIFTIQNVINSDYKNHP